MAVDAMDIDSSPTPAAVAEVERKRKHRTKDKTSKKKRKHESSLISDETAVHDATPKKSKSKGKSSKTSSKTALHTPDSPYVLTTATLYLPLSPISISPTHALASLMAEHLSPLLLTYYPPLQGVILAYSNASISSEPPTPGSTASEAQDPNPQPLTLAKTADEYGVLYVYLTATFLVFRPQRGQVLEGWVNVQSEGFLGAVVLNLFSVGIERKRLPSDWKWAPPGDEDEDTSSTNQNKKTVFSSTEEEADADEDSSDPSSDFDPEKEHFKPITLASDANPFADPADAENPVSADDGDHDDAAAEGYFQSVSGHRVRGTVRFRVVDIDVIPGTDRERGFLSIEGSMLSPEEEAKLTEAERNGILPSATPRRNHTMSGGLGLDSSAAITDFELDADADADAEPSESPSKRKAPKGEKEDKKKKSKSSKSKKKEK